jgi:hypothetical protein
MVIVIKGKNTLNVESSYYLPAFEFLWKNELYLQQAAQMTSKKQLIK